MTPCDAHKTHSVLLTDGVSRSRPAGAVWPEPQARQLRQPAGRSVGAAIALALVCLLAGCGDDGPTVNHGTVMAHKYTPGWSETRCTNTVQANGGMRMTCLPVWHPDEYELRVQGPSSENDSVQLQEWVTVDPATYAGCEVGNQWRRDRGCSS